MNLKNKNYIHIHARDTHNTYGEDKWVTKLDVLKGFVNIMMKQESRTRGLRAYVESQGSLSQGDISSCTIRHLWH